MTMLSHFAASGGAIPNYIEDVFSTWLYTGNGSTQTINNGIDLAGKGGLVWCKARSAANSNFLFDTARGANALFSNLTNGQQSEPQGITSFNANGFTLGTNGGTNGADNTFVSWTFREQPKFFDVVTFTTNASGVGSFSHSLGAVPGMVVFKRTDNTEGWFVYHRSLNTTSNYLMLNSTNGQGNIGGAWYSATTTTVTAGLSAGTPFAANGTYVAYLFAHNAGGFGLTGTDNVISCGSFTTSSIGLATVDLGYEPQWILYKGSNGVTNWQLVDNMRGFVVGAANSGTSFLNANTSAAEGTNPPVGITNTGFNFDGPANISYIYIAIRRGPMRTPTTGTSVFAPVANTQSSGTVRTIGFPADLAISTGRTTNLQRMFNDRLRGFSQTNTSTGPRLFSNTTDAETTSFTGVGAVTNTGYQDGDYFDPGISMIRYLFRRAPGFFDEVCYTGTKPTVQTVTHNLGVVPELMIVKNRSSAGGWNVWNKTIFAANPANFLRLQSDYFADPDNSRFNSTAPTSTAFTVGTDNDVNMAGAGLVAYLFASCPGVSKVGSYTGTGTTQVINCGFTAGSRFVLIKRTDSTGDWYVWDSARGIVAGNDPYLLLNNTAAEVTNTDFIDTAATGFEISSTAPAAINANGGTYIFLAIA